MYVAHYVWKLLWLTEKALSCVVCQLSLHLAVGVPARLPFSAFFQVFLSF